jgi:hypothetical protein
MTAMRFDQNNYEAQALTPMRLGDHTLIAGIERREFLSTKIRISSAESSRDRDISTTAQFCDSRLSAFSVLSDLGGRPDNHFAGASAQLKPSLRSVGASRA